MSGCNVLSECFLIAVLNIKCVFLYDLPQPENTGLNFYPSVYN